MCDGVLHRMLRYAKHLHNGIAVVGEHRGSKFQCTTTSTVGWQDQSHPLNEEIRLNIQGANERDLKQVLASGARR